MNNCYHETHIFNFENTDALLNFLIKEWGYSYDTAFELMQRQSVSKSTDNYDDRILLLKTEQANGFMHWELTNTIYSKD